MALDDGPFNITAGDTLVIAGSDLMANDSEVDCDMLCLKHTWLAEVTEDSILIL